MRCRTLVVGIALTLPALAGCGGSESRIADPAGDLTAASGAADHEKVMIVSRTAPVPEATNANERLVFVRAGSVWMMGADGQDPEQ